MTARDIVMSAAGNAGDGKTYIEDVFSTYLYTGNGSTQTINNGIDLASKGGMVWLKSRGTPSTSSGWHTLYDTARGVTKPIYSNDTSAENTIANTLTGFNSNGFTHGPTWYGENGLNVASWTFRKAPKFFDVVTYTGNGSNQTLSHSLGVTPGMIVIKKTSGTGNWSTWHKDIGNKYILLNTTGAAENTGLSARTVTSTTFEIYGAFGDEGASGATYVAYLFAHDTTTDGLIQCGSFTTDASGNDTTVTLGWEPQYLLFKRTDSAENWYVFDNMRGLTVGGNDPYLFPNLSNAEIGSTDYWKPTATGFTGKLSYPGTYIYMAIRRGPMKTPTDGTKVFNPLLHTSSNSVTTATIGFPTDLSIIKIRNTTDGARWVDRLRGITGSSNSQEMNSSSTSAEYTANDIYNAQQTTVTIGGFGVYDNVLWNFRRAPGFFDVVCYTGTGVARTVNHNLGVAPELIIIKNRSSAIDWGVYSQSIGINKALFLNLNNTPSTFSYWGSNSPTATTFEVGGSAAWGSGNFVAYLFASCPGVSKVGGYTGNGSSQTINCGFSAGARFVLIKRTDSTGDWYVWDTARGIVAATDPHLSLNTTAAEVTTDDTIDPDSTGFIVNQVAATNVNVNAATYIYLAIA